MRAVSAVAVAAIAGAVACRQSYPVGKLAVRVIDESNAPVRNVAADLFKLTPSGRVYWRAVRTGSNGTAVFAEKTGVIEGDYAIRLTLLAWQRLAPDEPPERTVKLEAGDDTIITFHVLQGRPARATPRTVP
ncbi:MAG TPA: hypothetical protein VFP77_04420 [Gemmatimonadaceae bacterium]|jgi:hypothetical protein|nr:hypothetical protein [Gemmatimonadaceae bacterium]